VPGELSMDTNAVLRLAQATGHEAGRHTAVLPVCAHDARRPGIRTMRVRTRRALHGLLTFGARKGGREFALLCMPWHRDYGVEINGVGA